MDSAVDSVVAREFNRYKTMAEQEAKAKVEWPRRWSWLLPEMERIRDEEHKYTKELPTYDRTVVQGPHLVVKPVTYPTKPGDPPRPPYPRTTNGQYGWLSAFPYPPVDPVIPKYPIEPPELDEEELRLFCLNQMREDKKARLELLAEDEDKDEDKDEHKDEYTFI